jgi:hypothetical protein
MVVTQFHVSLEDYMLFIVKVSPLSNISVLYIRNVSCKDAKKLWFLCTLSVETLSFLLLLISFAIYQKQMRW